jgi:hypothetical protein
MLTRVNAILALKDVHSLDEIRESLANKTTAYKLDETLRNVSDMEPDFIESLKVPSSIAEIDLESLAAVVGLYEMAKRADVEKSKAKEFVEEALTAISESTQLPTMVMLVKTTDSWHFVMASHTTWIALDKGLLIIEAIQVADVIERIRTRLPELSATQS